MSASASHRGRRRALAVRGLARYLCSPRRTLDLRWALFPCVCLLWLFCRSHSWSQVRCACWDFWKIKASSHSQSHLSHRPRSLMVLDHHLWSCRRTYGRLHCPALRCCWSRTTCLDLCTWPQTSPMLFCLGVELHHQTVCGWSRTPPFLCSHPRWNQRWSCWTAPRSLTFRIHFAKSGWWSPSWAQWSSPMVLSRCWPFPICSATLGCCRWTPVSRCLFPLG